MHTAGNAHPKTRSSMHLPSLPVDPDRGGENRGNIIIYQPWVALACPQWSGTPRTCVATPPGLTWHNKITQIHTTTSNQLPHARTLTDRNAHAAGRSHYANRNGQPATGSAQHTHGHSPSQNTPTHILIKSLCDGVMRIIWPVWADISASRVPGRLPPIQGRRARPPNGQCTAHTGTPQAKTPQHTS
jgi:hypothetical protein